MTSSERSDALVSAFPGETELTPAQIAQCAAFAREHIVHLCIADPLPMRVRLLGKQVHLRRSDLADYFAGEVSDIQALQAEEAASIAAASRGQSVSRREVVDCLFRAELRFALFSAESIRAFSTLVDGIEKMGPSDDSASPVDERCREYFDMERVVLGAQAKAMHVGLRGLLHDTFAAPTVPASRRHRNEG
jgi:hypothetical protein